ncbi:MAG: hypothetical protein IH910_03560 [Proteobacteria bacterium]|nr:hypothetical protein [Pseudomonadota bacterium]
MKRTVLALFISVTLFGSDIVLAAKSECKIAQDSVDDFTHEHVVVTEWEGLSHPVRPGGREMTGFVSAVSNGDGHFLRVNIEHFWSKRTLPTEDDMQNSISVAEGAELLVAMVDGSVVTLQASKATVGKTTIEDRPKPHSGDSFWLMTKATAHYALNDANEQVLTAQGSKALRMTTESGNRDLRFYSKSFDEISRVIKCVTGAMK